MCNLNWANVILVHLMRFLKGSDIAFAQLVNKSSAKLKV